MDNENNENIDVLRFQQKLIITRELGESYLDAKILQKSLNYFEEAYLLAKHLYLLKSPMINNDELFAEIGVIQNKIVEILKNRSEHAISDNNFEDALGYYLKIYDYEIPSADVLTKLATCLDACGAYNSAIFLLNKVLETDSKNSWCYSFLAYLYGYRLKAYEMSIEYFEKYLEFEPNDAYAYNSLGHINDKLYGASNADKQIELFKRALELKPDFTDAIRNLAIVYPRIGKFDESISCYKKLFSLVDLPDDYFSYACLQIQLENFEEGWKYLEARFDKTIGATLYPKLSQPIWRGEDISDKTILVNFEQGFGDTIQFFRYIPKLKSIAQKVILRVQNQLYDLISQNTDVEVVSHVTDISTLTFDYHVPMMNLPAVFKTNKTNIPLSSGYLQADKEKSALFKKEAFNNNYKKIGISWHGALTGNTTRDVPIEAFKPLLKLQNCKIYSFQKDTPREELLRLSPDVCNLGNVFHDFSDTAAAMDNIDVLVTSDNSVLHVAAAMGKKVILLLNKYAEWRWFFDDKNTPWYDSIKIIKKQNETDSWESLIEQALIEIS